ncbi:MAG: ribosomal protein S18-alanine N-acetyltransferase [Candidatus Binatia bacterium]
MTDIFLRALVEKDLPTVLAIEEASFLSPWTRASFLHELHSSHSQLTVAEQQGEIIGYICCWYVVDEVHILDIAVRPESRRQGVGERLLRHALAIGRQKGAQSANLEVRRSNLPAIALYGKFGFRQVAVRQRYYTNGEDALLLVRHFSSEEKSETDQ